VGDDGNDDVSNGDDCGNDAGDNPGKGDSKDAGVEGGGWILVENEAAAAAAVVAVALAVVAVTTYCRVGLLFIGKIFLCGIFMCGGNRHGHTSTHPLVMLKVCRLLLGGDGNGPHKLWYANTKNYLAKKALQPKLVVIYTKVLRTKK
jgi:hypothetical protein